MRHNNLFEPYSLGPLTLSNRIVLAPLTRNRAGAGFVPGPATLYGGGAAGYTDYPTLAIKRANT